MKRILIYFFCLAITLQSVVGQLFLFDYSTGSFGMSSSVTTLFERNASDKRGDGSSYDISQKDINVEHKHTDLSYPGSSRFVTASAVEHCIGLHL